MPGAMNSCPKNETGCLAFGIALWMERVASGQGVATFPGHVLQRGELVRLPS